MSIVLVTGGLGFIGSHISVALLKKGHSVLIIDSLLNSSEDNFLRIKNLAFTEDNKNVGKVFFEKADLREKSALAAIFSKFKDMDIPISSVIHCAGIKSVEESVYKPLNYWEININSTLSLLSVMKRYDCHILVFSSSATIYETRVMKKLTENSSLGPLNPYGNTKLSIEMILKDLYKSESGIWRIANLRYFNPAGAHFSGFLGEIPKYSNTNLFPIIFKVAKTQNQSLYIYGRDWPTPDGTCIRDYIHIMDLADAHIATLDFLEMNKPQNIILNIGTGKGTSVLEVLQTFKEVHEIPIPFEFTKRREGDNPYLVASNELAISLLDWKPKKTLIDICIDGWRWVNNLY